jgi:hypothetical protein
VAARGRGAGARERTSAGGRPVGPVGEVLQAAAQMWAGEPGALLPRARGRRRSGRGAGGVRA